MNKYIAFIVTTEETKYSGGEDWSHWVGSQALQDPDMLRFKTLRDFQGDGEFYECEEDYFKEVNKVEAYLESLGYKRMEFNTIRI